MGNTLCKPAINPPIQNVEQPKDIEPLLTEEAIKILVVNETETVIKEEPVVTEPIIKEEPVVTEPEKVVEPVVTEPIIEEIKEPIISEVTVDTLVNEEKLSLVPPPDEASSTSSKEDELVTPMKKKRGRKKKGEQ
jgi:2-phospho-L-lactate transferase/gluconeogenesis factor (CofD/UPF0052 family)